MEIIMEMVELSVLLQCHARSTSHHSSDIKDSKYISSGRFK